jgi:hypothetical protein
MSKKLMTGLLALVALAALALPAAASAANNPLVVENGTAVAVGKKITATNVGPTVMTTSLGNVECSTAILTGELTKNTTGTVEGNITDAKFGGTGALQAGAEEPECTTFAIFGGDTTITPKPATNGLPWCIRSTTAMAEHEFQVRGNSCAGLARPIRFAMDITNIGTCVYQRTAAIPGKYTTSTTDSTLSISEVEFTKFEGPFTCPGSGKLDMTFTMETDATPATSLGITS